MVDNKRMLKIDCHYLGDIWFKRLPAGKELEFILLNISQILTVENHIDCGSLIVWLYQRQSFETWQFGDQQSMIVKQMFQSMGHGKNKSYIQYNTM